MNMTFVINVKITFCHWTVDFDFQDHGIYSLETRWPHFIRNYVLAKYEK